MQKKLEPQRTATTMTTMTECAAGGLGGGSRRKSFKLSEDAPSKRGVRGHGPPPVTQRVHIPGGPPLDTRVHTPAERSLKQEVSRDTPAKCKPLSADRPPVSPRHASGVLLHLARCRQLSFHLFQVPQRVEGFKLAQPSCLAGHATPRRVPLSGCAEERSLTPRASPS